MQPDIRTIRREVREQRGRLIPLGILLVILGAVAIVSAAAATLATVLLFGVLLAIGGVAQIFQALTARSEGFAWELVGGMLYLIAGGLILSDPASGAVGITFLLALFFLFVGILRISLGFRLRRRRGVGGAYLGAGVLDLILGLLIVLGWPETGAWVVGLFLGIELVVAGTSLLIVTTAVRRGEALSP